MLYDLLITLLLSAATGVQPWPTATLPSTVAVVSMPAVVPVPQRIPDASIGVPLTARAAAVVDVGSGAVLHQYGGTPMLPIASITKLATALVFLRLNPGWDTEVTMQAADRRTGGMVVLVPGEVVTVRDLWHAMLVSSSNEAAAALARVSGLDEPAFVAEMNALAAELGLAQARFTDPAGLDPGNVATAAAVGSLSAAAFAQTEIAEAVQQEQSVLRPRGRRPRTVTSTGRYFGTFLNDGTAGYAVTGAKTGYLDEAGYNVTAQVVRDGHPITVTVLGSASATLRWQELKSLAVWTYGHYRWPTALGRLSSRNE